jgi:histidinol-phosphate phosphatase family protein
VRVDVVIPSLGRPSLTTLLAALAAEVDRADAPPPELVVVVDDRPRRSPTSPLPPLVTRAPGVLRDRVTVLTSGGQGPAAARNRGWRAGRSEWVAFLDDDVVPAPGWLAALRRDLGTLGPGSAASQGTVEVPLPSDRRPTDNERVVAGLAGARWITADIAYRRRALEDLGGFDERFRRAYREDADLALRARRAGWDLATGRRLVRHPVAPAPWWISVARQRGNADDVLMDALHGRDWRRRAAAPRGRRRRHLAVTGCAALAGVAAVGPRPRLAAGPAAAAAAGIAELAVARVRPGPRHPGEVAAMVATSVALPFAATWWTLVGWLRRRRLLDDRARAPQPGRVAPPAAAILFDRDGTLVVDVPYNGDPARVQPVPTAGEALALVRAAGVATGVVTNQSGVARGYLTTADVDAVHERIEILLGPLGPWSVCVHDDTDGCACRKPAPGLVLDAAAALGVDPASCVVIGDTGADVAAGLAAGARSILVPNARTRPEEVAAAPQMAATLVAAVRAALGPGGRRATVAP